MSSEEPVGTCAFSAKCSVCSIVGTEQTPVKTGLADEINCKSNPMSFLKSILRMDFNFVFAPE